MTGGQALGLAAAVAVAALVATGCSDDDTGAPGPPVSSAPPRTTGEAASTTAAPITAAPTTVPSPTTTGAGSSPATADPGGEAATTTPPATTAVPADRLEMAAYPVAAGSRPHDVAPAADGGVWYTAQGSGDLGWLDPVTGETRVVDLGPGARPHGVIVRDDGTAWITDGGLNAIVAVDPGTSGAVVHPLPPERSGANLNTATFDGDGVLWFTGQAGVYGRLDPASGAMEVFDAPRGPGPYGITTAPDGTVYYASLAGSYVGRIEADGTVTVLEPPDAGQGARRVWADGAGAVWVSEWNTGQLSRYDPATGAWAVWPLPGEDPRAYAVFADDAGSVWVTDFGGNAIHRFVPASETFDTFPLPSLPGEVRQLHGRAGEVWGAESAADQLVVIRTAP